MKCQACSREMESIDSTKVSSIERNANGIANGVPRRVVVGSKVHHLRATFTYEAGRTRGNDRELQLPGVTCILRPPRHDDPLLSLSLSLSLIARRRCSDDPLHRAWIFTAIEGDTDFLAVEIDRHSILDRSANSYHEPRTCLRRHYSHDFIVDSSSLTTWVHGVRRTIT